MKSALLTTLMLVAVGSHPVFAAQCQFGSCNADTAASIELLVSEIQTNKDEVLKKINDASSPSDAMAKQVESYLNNGRLKVNTDSTRKGPGNEIVKPTDELAPVRQLKAIRPELVQNPITLPVVAFYERLA
ncbi:MULTISPECIES: hypothetical protein [Escherichia]|uniref:hypothetical protein n=1 Tax=Escherichia TaxID=561 RepID=UPI000BE41878|nr:MULTISPECIES: hypothetical protein [Escherichia]EKR5116712.1 hypothetical protein [Escherichia coli]EKR5144201.1 hypothetical protein [Escherichia coli]ELD1747000.1 hypothetical protein [Escherichia coli]ELO4849633.1 hypothetical protein [Escherichia coli]ELO5052421.1 hypothetical protein [Escherichia coli]